MKPIIISSSAEFSLDRRYRYWLQRAWQPAGKTLAVIGLNPSTADESANDPTVAKCMVWAQRMGFARLLMLNMFAWRDTDPKNLWYADRRGIDIVGGPPNFVLSLQEYCTRFGVSQIIAAWGNLPHCRGRQDFFRAAPWNLDCFETNADGSPHHPLYLPYTLIPKPWNYEKEQNVSA